MYDYSCLDVYMIVVYILLVFARVVRERALSAFRSSCFECSWMSIRFYEQMKWDMNRIEKRYRAEVDLRTDL